MERIIIISSSIIPFQAIVVRKASEMPEGVELSDGGDASDDGLAADDPHRALGDISLDDIEYTAPYKSKSDENSRYESNSFATSANGGLDGVPDSLFGKAEKVKKPKKAKKVEEVVESGKKSKKSKKEKKEKKEKKRDKEKEPSSDLHKGEIPGTDDVDFWLSNDVTAAK